MKGDFTQFVSGSPLAAPTREVAEAKPSRKGRRRVVAILRHLTRGNLKRMLRGKADAAVSEERPARYRHASATMKEALA